MSIKSNNQTNRWHQAVYNLYPAAKSVDEQGNAFDTNNNPVAIDEAAVGVETERLDAIKAATWYRVVRERAYPSVNDFMEAYTEKEIGEDSTKWDAYVTAYNKVRTDNPKD
tara:strand:+ start:385 stop:717 length:333 start_codon:yes stop_codon:yes gene_type:complete